MVLGWYLVFGMVWYGYDMVCYLGYMVWYGILGMIWYGMVWYSMAWDGLGYEHGMI